jgi:hypothetical protein
MRKPAVNAVKHFRHALRTVQLFPGAVVRSVQELIRTAQTNEMVVPAAGLEPARPFDRQILSLLCLPFHQAGTQKTLTALPTQIKGVRHLKLS